MNRRIFPAVCFLVAGFFAARSAGACTIPVFRYALDRWPSEPWILEAQQEAFTQEPLATSLRNLGPTSPINLEASPLPEKTSGEPAARLRFPRSGREEPAVSWTGALTTESFAALTDSPARREIARRILSGDSLVWVVVQAGGDTTLADRVAGRLKFLSSAAQLPVIDPNDPDSQLGPGPELKVQFSHLVIARDLAAEAALVGMLAGEKGLAQFPPEKSFAALVFGRGRVLGAWAQDELTDDRVDESTIFLCGACSCQAKALNPGWDLLMAVSWDEELRRAGGSETEAPPAPRDPAGSSPGRSAPQSVAIPTGNAAQPGVAAPPRTEGSATLFWWFRVSLVLILLGFALWGYLGKEKRQRTHSVEE
jgi:hypothetical protein